MEADPYIPSTGVYPSNEFIPPEFLDENGWLRLDDELRVQAKEGDILPIDGAGDITNNRMRLVYEETQQGRIIAANCGLP
jgi:hypothetical protein